MQLTWEHTLLLKRLAALHDKKYKYWCAYKSDFDRVNCICNICGKDFFVYDVNEHGVSHIKDSPLKAFL